MRTAQLVSLAVKRVDLRFIKPARTSRDTLLSKPSWIIRAMDLEGRIGWGECSLILGLSPESEEAVELFFEECRELQSLSLDDVPSDMPAVHMAVEMVLLSLSHEDPLAYFPGSFSNGSQFIEMNGLIWMDTPEGMLSQAQQLRDSGFETLKMKVGSMPFDAEWGWLRELRQEVSNRCVLRCDANGAFSKFESRWTPMKKLEALAALEFHSIEQPLRPEDVDGLARLCADSPLPIALDESLIGVEESHREALLDAICPQFLILKPSLVGGFRVSQQWVHLAESRGVGWWATSALESNLGLTAIAQWVGDGVQTATPKLPQGLGTGALFENNLESSMEVAAGQLKHALERPVDMEVQFERLQA